MKKLSISIVFFLMFVSLSFAQTPSMIFYNGEMPDDMYVWPWGFNVDPESAPNTGYTPGTSALKWVTYDGGGWQGAFIGLSSNVGVDMTSIWETDSVYFRIKAPAGLADSDTLFVWLYESRNDTWDYAIYYEVTNFQDIEDGNWHQFSIALKDFIVYVNDINKTDIVAVSFEASGSGIASEMYFDKVWIGKPDIPITMTIFNGQVLMPGITWEAWGFENNDLVLADGEGFSSGTPAIVWETSNWDWQGKGFIFEIHDFTYSFTQDTVKLKIKAPAGINNLALEFYDVNYNSTWAVARRVLDDVTWDGEWKVLDIPLTDFTVDENFDVSKIYELGAIAADATIPERLLLDEIWIGNPSVSIDIEAPPAPENITADVSIPYVNFIAWDDITSESGETYDVYASLSPITDLNAPGIYIVATDVGEGELAVHNIYFPLSEGQITYYYAVSCTDKAGNISETFGVSQTPFTNKGKKRAIISLDPPQDFVADGYFSEWEHIMPFNLNPERNLYTGTIDDSLDYSLNCYVAMDNENLYVAFDVFDDAFTWKESNTQDWWEDEAIEFYFGLYELGFSHSYFYRGEEPDYRILFLPDRLELWSGESLVSGTENYYFEPLGNADYVIEAKIPFEKIQVEGDSTYTPKTGTIIPFEIFAADADVEDGGNESRLQLGNNATLNPWGAGPEVWTYAWVGMPDFTAVGENNSPKVVSYYLGDNYPNPFNPSTTINYGIAQSSNVELLIYNSLGQKVATVVNQRQIAGNYTVNFDASNLASGIYFYKISTEKFSKIKKMLIIK